MGVGKKLDGWLKKKGEDFKEWKAKEPERRAKRLEKLRGKLEEMQLKKQIHKERAEMMNDRIELDKKRREAMDNIPSMFDMNINSGSKDTKPPPPVADILGFGGQHDKGSKKGRSFP